MVIYTPHRIKGAVPLCGFCEQPARFVCPQSTTGGDPVVWVLACQMHADGWWEGCDWEGPIFRLGKQVDYK